MLTFLNVFHTSYNSFPMSCNAKVFSESKILIAPTIALQDCLLSYSLGKLIWLTHKVRKQICNTYLPTAEGCNNHIEQRGNLKRRKGNFS